MKENSLIILGSKQAKRKLIWLHGLGAGTSEEAKNIYQVLRLSDWEFIFPIAPIRQVAWADQAKLTAWFNMDLRGEVNPEDLQTSALYIASLVERYQQEAKNLVYLAGFSQGAALAIHCWGKNLINLPKTFALSGWLAVDFNNLAAEVGKLWIGHGEEDKVIPVQWARRSVDRLKKLGAKVDFHLYPMGHEICWTEIEDLRLQLAY